MKPKNPNAGKGMLKSTPGRHTRNPGYKPGRHWVLCQRCGLDYYDDEIKREWTGAIVCKSCWEPRHPQDFVRGRRDRITAPQPVNPDVLTNQDGVEGSTEVPLGTFIDIPTVTVVNQTDETGAAITTVETATWFTNPESETISFYSASPLPDGLSIDQETGDITGTPTESNTIVTVTAGAFYLETGRFITDTFTWDIEGFLSPASLGATGWWDFSDTTSVYTTDEVDTNVASSEDPAGVVYNQATKGTTGAPTLEASVGGTGVTEADRPTWDDIERNGRGAITFPDETTLAASQPKLDTAGTWNIADENTNVEYTIAMVIQTPTQAQIDAETTAPLWGSTNQKGFLPYWADEATEQYQFTIRTINNTAAEDSRGEPLLSDASGIEEGGWFLMVQTIDGDAAEIVIESTTFNEQAAETPPADLNLLGDTEVHGGLSIGSARGSNGTAIGGGYPAYIGEVAIFNGILTTAEVEQLYGYFNDKWTLDGTMN